MNLRAVPLDDDNRQFWLDCDQCGPIGVVDRIAVHGVATLHLTAHGIDVPPMVHCECGYDYTRVTGHDLDHATCTECGWQAYGMFADHQGHHHYLDTQHTWQITMGDRR